MIKRQSITGSVLLVGKGCIVSVAALGLLAVAGLTSELLLQPERTFAEDMTDSSTPESEKPKYTDDGQLIPFKADVYREWIFVGTPVTPNDLNDGEASFPEFHNVYINPYAWQVWKKTGTFPNGTIMVKELTSVGAKHAPSGSGYFEGEFTGLEMAVKDTSRYPAESKGWGYYSYGHKYPLKTQAPLNKIESCAACHAQSAGDDMVFIQYYPVLRAAKGK